MVAGEFKDKKLCEVHKNYSKIVSGQKVGE